MTDPNVLTVTCRPDGTSWRCQVSVGNDAGATRHDVTVLAMDLQRYGGASVSAEELVSASFAFLLEREPRESILTAFEFGVISRYFPDYEGEIRRRLGA